MKDLTITLLLFSFSIACTKGVPDEPINPPPPPIDTISHIVELGKTSILGNGIPWNALLSAYYYTDDKSRFSLRGMVKQGGLDHLFAMQDISSRKGLQTLERRIYWNASNGIPDAVYIISLDGDQMLNSYSVDTTIANQYIEILRYDSVTQIVEGRFQTFLEGPTTWSFLPDTMKMTEGKFHLKIKE